MQSYGGYFSTVFVVLHPFLRSKTVPIDQFRRDTCKSKIQTVDECEAVTWAEVIEHSDFENISQIDTALRSSISGVVESRHREDLVDLLHETTESLELFVPLEGDIPPHVELEIWDGLRTAGIQKVKIASEFGEPIEEHSLEGIFERDCIPPHGVIFDDKLNFHIASHWDSHCTFLALRIETDFPRLEKFKCNNQTQVFWGLYPEGNP